MIKGENENEGKCFHNAGVINFANARSKTFLPEFVNPLFLLMAQSCLMSRHKTLTVAKEVNLKKMQIYLSEKQNLIHCFIFSVNFYDFKLIAVIQFLF